MLLRFASWRGLLAGVVFWLSALGARAQVVPPHGYEFLTVLVVESYSISEAKIVVVPAFQGKSEIPLASIEPQHPVAKRMADIVQNTATVNQLLSDLTVAGWEFLQPYAVPPTGVSGDALATRYLFRRPRP